MAKGCQDNGGYFELAIGRLRFPLLRLFLLFLLFLGTFGHFWLLLLRSPAALLKVPVAAISHTDGLSNSLNNVQPSAQIPFVIGCLLTKHARDKDSVKSLTEDTIDLYRGGEQRVWPQAGGGDVGEIKVLQGPNPQHWGHGVSQLKTLLRATFNERFCLSFFLLSLVGLGGWHMCSVFV